MTEPNTAIQFNGHFYANLKQGETKLFSEIKFTASLDYVIADADKFNTIMGGQLPLDLMKQNASFATEKTFTNLFEEGCSLDELKYKVDTQSSLILQDSSLVGWEERCGIKAVQINNMAIEIDPQTLKLFSFASIATSAPAPAPTNNSSWKCTCGSMNSGNFCPRCGNKKPEDWVCSCGNVNKGKFCSECGTPRGF